MIHIAYSAIILAGAAERLILKSDLIGYILPAIIVAMTIAFNWIEKKTTKGEENEEKTE